jgi:2-oxoisovalerate dehydrogenase E2 component (dihydrolipoyl transacylase)
MSRYLVTMPQLGESVTEGTISRWLVMPGDSVSEFDAMVEINTDKVDAEVPAPVTGVVIEILAAEGMTVAVGDNIAVLEIETGDDGRTASEKVPEVAPESEPASPRAESLTKLEQANSEATSPGESPVPPSHGPTPPQLPAESSGTALVDEILPLTPVRRLIAERMTLSKTTIPHAWQTQEVDMSGVVASLARHRGAVRRNHGASLTYLSYVFRAVATSLREHSIVNSTFAGDHIVLHRAINIGIAVGIPRGVVVPVIRGADGLSIVDVAVAAADLTARAKDNALSAADLDGATFTLNNSGALGTLLSYSVIPPGQSAELTMGAVVDRPVSVDRKPTVRPMMYMCLSIDHRVMDGLEASGFLGSCRRWLEGVTADTEVV